MTSFSSTARPTAAARVRLRLAGVFRTAIGLVRRHRRAFLLLNAAALAAFAAGAVTAALVPGLQEATIAPATHQLSGNPIGTWVVSAYQGGNVLVAAALTFAVNLVLGSLLTMTVPSLIVPGFAIAFLVWRVFQWGVIFTPFAADAVALLPHDITLVVEGEAYVLVALAAWIAAGLLLRPGRAGLAGRRATWVAGIRETVSLYPLIVAVLLVAAVYEALEVVYLAP